MNTQHVQDDLNMLIITDCSLPPYPLLVQARARYYR
jgi:hypothetical protein